MAPVARELLSTSLVNVPAHLAETLGTTTGRMVEAIRFARAGVLALALQQRPTALDQHNGRVEE